MYHGVRGLLRDTYRNWGLKISTIDMTDLQLVEQTVQSNRHDNVVLWAETPSNPLLKVTDISSVGKICTKQNIPFIIDATWMTPWLCQPLGLGADMVVHSTTKYFGGHSDLTGGAIIRSSTCKDVGKELFNKAKFNQGSVGATPSAFDCWLTLRGMRSLGARMEVHSRNAMKVALFLKDHANVLHTHYPGLTSHPSHELTNKQYEKQTNSMSYGGMVSFQVNGNEQNAVNVVGRTEIFKRATSLGGTESLIEHRSSVEGPDTKTPTNLIRLSIGLEDPTDLIHDLSNALKF
jgi:cystathionine gamma-synthase